MEIYSVLNLVTALRRSLNKWCTAMGTKIDYWVLNSWDSSNRWWKTSPYRITGAAVITIRYANIRFTSQILQDILNKIRHCKRLTGWFLDKAYILSTRVNYLGSPRNPHKGVYSLKYTSITPKLLGASASWFFWEWIH